MIGPHRVRARLAEGKPVLGAIVNFSSPWFVDIAASAGFDFVMLDAEHGPLSPALAEPMVRSAEAGGISPLVRVPANLTHEILRYLDIGAVGVQVPHVESAAEAQAAIDAVRYHPEGKRGLAGITRAAGYGASISLSQYMEIANRELMCLVMVETQAGVEHVDEIAAVQGVDAIIIGPNDLSASMGFAGQLDVPKVQDAIDRIIDSAKRHNRWVSLPATSPEAARAALSRGANFIQVAASGWLIREGRNFLQATIASEPT